MKGLRLTEWITVLILVLSIFFFASLFLYEQNRSTGSGSGQTVGELTFRYRIAERKFTDSVLWDRINPGDPLRNGDWIRTDSYSEAVLELGDGSRVEMAPETMLVLIIDEDKKELQLMQGSLELDLKDDYDLLADNRRIKNLEGKARVRLSEESLEIEQDSPGASMDGENLPSWSTIGEGGVQERNSGLTLLAPVDTRTVVEGETEVNFRWSGSCPCELSIGSSDSQFSVKDLDDNQHRISLKPGIYSWNVQNSDGKSATRSFRLLKSQPLKPVQPAAGSTVFISRDSGLILFSWEGAAFRQKFRIEVSESPGMENGQTLETSRRNAVFSLKPGKYYWRITSLAGLPDESDTSKEVTSKVLSFEIKPQEEENQELAINLKVEKEPAKEQKVYTPRANPQELWQANVYPIFPQPNSAVDMSQRDSLLFKWSPVPRANKYLFRLYRDDSILIERFVTNPYLNFRELTLLDTAWFEWSVEPIFSDGRSGSGFQHRFQVTLSEQLEKPELE
ncbi:MAG: hypothetical protein CMF59_17500 [Leptospiraceae bacterium]|nr:hypothetical protein [Leptospiraceae bacterium]